MLTPLIVVIDQIAKFMVVSNFELGELRLITDWLHPYLMLTYTRNTGVAFGLLAGNNAGNLALSLIIVGILLYVYRQSSPLVRWQHVAFAMVLGGAVGNIIDRFARGFVVDFAYVYLDLPFITIANVSNFADHAVVLGAGLYIVDSLLHPPVDPDQRNDAADNAHDADQEMAGDCASS